MRGKLKIPYEEMPKMKFGRLKPIRIVEGKGPTKWLCKCDCGNEAVVTHTNLSKGDTRSCGCLHRELNGKRTHGLTRTTRLYNVFYELKSKCYNPNHKLYKLYGEKGATICKEWLEDFKEFYDWSIKNGYNEELPRGEQTLGRIDINGDFCPENCRWITLKEQIRQTRNSKKYLYKGEEHLLCEWSEILGLDFGVLRTRIYGLGWSIERALSTPVKKLNKKAED